MREAGMVQREFFCPKCRSSLQKSDAMMMLSEIHQNGDNYMGNVTVEHVTCPACGTDISVKDIVAGKFDSQNGPIGTLLGLAVLAGIIFFTFQACSS
jgi:transcription initiation factor IIE alpha subunit